MGRYEFRRRRDYRRHERSAEGEQMPEAIRGLNVGGCHTYTRKLVAEMVRMLAHFLVADQLMGFSASWSSGSSHQTVSEAHGPSRWLALRKYEVVETCTGHAGPLDSAACSMSSEDQGLAGVREDAMLSGRVLDTVSKVNRRLTYKLSPPWL